MKPKINEKEFIALLKQRKFTRSKLENYLGIPDRQCRKYIEKLRLKGHLIINLKDGDGYYIPTEKAEAADYMVDYYAKFVSMGKVIEAMTEAYKKMT